MLFDNGVYPSRKGVKVSTSQTLGALTGTIGTLSGNYLDTTPTSITTSPYSPGSFYLDHEILYDLNYGNISGIGAMYIATTLGAFQMSFTPKIDKDVTKRLELNIRVSWGRYTP